MITVEKPVDRTKYSLLSVVIPVYQEGSHIKNTVKIIEDVLISNNITYEFIFVDDGSTDNTFSELKSLARDNWRVSVVRLSRNFGKESAICAGLDYAAGDMILTMDADLQHPPEVIPAMVDAWLNEGYDVVEESSIPRQGKYHLQGMRKVLLLHGQQIIRCQPGKGFGFQTHGP